MSKEQITFDSKLPTVKVKGRPRGKGFLPGNTHGNRFRPGESGNPSGRPKCKKINEAARKFLGSDLDKPLRIQTVADAVVAKGIRKAKKGDLGWATFLANRAEGLPVQGLSIQNENDPLKTLCDLMTERYSVVGRPDGFIPRQKLGAGDGNDQ